MRRLLSLMALCWATLVILPAQSIEWTPDRALAWGNFKAPVDPQSTLSASSHCRIEYSYKFSGNDLTIAVKTLFGPTKSWVRKGTESPWLLKHETAHFDIAELYSRELRKAFSTYTLQPSTVKEDLKAIFDVVWKEYRAKQNEYDHATNHGINRSQQTEWEKWVAEQMTETWDWSLEGLMQKAKVEEEGILPDPDAPAVEEGE